MPTTTHSIVNFVLPGEVVFDIGANLGEKTAWFADRGARVIAIEPQPKLVSALRERFVNNPLVSIVPMGVADKTGTLKMSISDDHFVSTFSEEWREAHFNANIKYRMVDINVTTIDDLIESYGIPRYTKIDVEGYEKLVMRGLSRKLDVLSFEYSSDMLDQAEDICGRLSSLGFSYFNVSFGELPDFIFPDHWQPADKVLERLRSHAAIDPMNWGDIYAA